MKSTLVIHPKDSTTDCLQVIYQNRDWNVIRDPNTSSKVVEEAIKAHDRIIMLGHGGPRGLLAAYGGSRFGRYIVDDNSALFLHPKETYSIWCNSDIYFDLHRMKGFHTGMIISEVGEEIAMLGEAVLNEEEMAKNMELFCRVCAESIDLEPEEAKAYVLENYVGEDEVTQFNRERIVVL